MHVCVCLCVCVYMRMRQEQSLVGIAKLRLSYIRTRSRKLQWAECHSGIVGWLISPLPSFAPLSPLAASPRPAARSHCIIIHFCIIDAARLSAENTADCADLSHLFQSLSISFLSVSCPFPALSARPLQWAAAAAMDIPLDVFYAVAGAQSGRRKTSFLTHTLSLSSLSLLFSLLSSLSLFVTHSLLFEAEVHLLLTRVSAFLFLSLRPPRTCLKTADTSCFAFLRTVKQPHTHTHTLTPHSPFSPYP